MQDVQNLEKKLKKLELPEFESKSFEGNLKRALLSYEDKKTFLSFNLNAMKKWTLLAAPLLTILIVLGYLFLTTRNDAKKPSGDTFLSLDYILTKAEEAYKEGFKKGKFKHTITDTKLYNGDKVMEYKEEMISTKNNSYFLRIMRDPSTNEILDANGMDDGNFLSCDNCKYSRPKPTSDHPMPSRPPRPLTVFWEVGLINIEGRHFKPQGEEVDVINIPTTSENEAVNYILAHGYIELSQEEAQEILDADYKERYPYTQSWQIGTDKLNMTQYQWRYFQVNDHYFKLDVPFTEDVPWPFAENDYLRSEQSYISDLKKKGYVEITKEQMDQEVKDYLKDHREEEEKRAEEYQLKQMIKMIEDQDPNSCGSGDGARVEIDCHGEYYVQFFPIPYAASLGGMNEDISEMTPEQRLEYLTARGFKKLSLEEVLKLRMGKSNDNLIYSLFLSFDNQDPQKIYKELKDSNATFKGEENVDGKDVLTIEFTSEFNGTKYITTAYFDAQTYNLFKAQIFKLNEQGEKSIEFEYKLYQLEYSDEKPVIDLGDKKLS